MSRVVPDGFELVKLDNGFGDHFGPVYRKEVNSRYVFAFRVSPHQLNIAGMCHGGAIATFADIQIAAIKPFTDLAGKHLPTRNLNMDYIAPVPAEAWVEMEVDFVRITRGSVYMHSQITANGKVAARSSATYHIP
ncbi:MAG: PaaI family thioesterase [Porticoccaceae bacterium]|nr:PaaI family thioesterase [Pseudomonadales bacterium]MCP5171066.1 PaaI family thioesterase [Pseudomonadales bacterium]MCP5301695.1 PaaI family thioesterase [Pseudomonadales bacterium]